VIVLGIGCSIIGSGLIASAFKAHPLDLDNISIYAAGVSNSTCSDPREFKRESSRLIHALKAAECSDAFVYFSTCSVEDQTVQASPYVKHKKAMESEVAEHKNYVIVRLPQLAGKSPNPHTLLNYLYARVSRSERFTVWARATRNIIDIDDVVPIVKHLLHDEHARRKIINVASPVSYPIRDIVTAMETVVGKEAIIDLIDKGVPYVIDTSTIYGICRDLDLMFDKGYLERVIRKYYGNREGHEY